ncbi:MAG: helix-turn-helix domain-containing protein [Lentisphaeria bacterium]|nr:helix-turn-helix domain-containing protein [Lentisphaeria bacterium]
MLEYKLDVLRAAALPLVIQRLKAPHYQEIHLHDAVELVYIEHGSGWCAVNGIIHPMLTGDLYIIPLGATHEYYCEKDLSYINILFNSSIFREDEQELYRAFSGQAADRMPDKYTFGPDLQPEILSRIDALNGELFSQEPYQPIRCRALFVELLVFIFRYAFHAPGIRASHAQIHLGRVLGYIADHLDAKLSMPRLAEISGYKTDYFGKLFRREIGVAVSEYIRSRRIERACYELEHADKSIDEIAQETGFFDTSYFIKTFKKYCGVTPLHFRRRSRKKQEDSR